MLTRRRLLALALCLPALAACRSRPKHAALPAGSTVLALGDSLTYGYGAPAASAYPEQLAAMTGWKVINGGVSGDTSAQALARLPALMKQHAPALVLTGIGGNDFLRKIPEAQTRADIGGILQTLQAASVPSVLIAEPHLSLGALVGSPSDHPLYAELAEQYRVPLLAGAWADILGDKGLKSDQIHANAAGYRVFAEKMRDFLREQGFYR